VVDSAPSMISGGGRDLEENITPGAVVASRGGRDQITQPPRSGLRRRGEGVEGVEDISSIWAWGGRGRGELVDGKGESVEGKGEFEDWRSVSSQ
jgi:hypothetical protein